MSLEWFFMRDGIKHGPISSKQLKELADSGKIQPTDLIWKQGFSDWRPAAILTVLFDPTGDRAVEPDHPQGQRSLNCCASKDFQQEVFAPRATVAFHGYTITARMLLQQ